MLHKFNVTIFALGIFGLVDIAATGGSTDIRTNCCTIQQAPSWLSSNAIQTVAKRVESDLQWNIRRVTVKFVSDPQQYRSYSSLQFPTKAFFNRTQNTIYMGPTVSEENYSRILGHELVHVVFAQKHKKAIPSWLEEGLANSVGSQMKPDYIWLNKQKIPEVTSLRHPNSDVEGYRMHYELSSAAVDLISSKCKLDDLLMMSVKRSVTDYLKTLCKIDNIDASVRDWVAQKGA